MQECAIEKIENGSEGIDAYVQRKAAKLAALPQGRRALEQERVHGRHEASKEIQMNSAPTV